MTRRISWGRGGGWRKEVSSGASEVVHVRDDCHLRVGGGWVDGIPPGQTEAGRILQVTDSHRDGQRKRGDKMNRSAV